MENLDDFVTALTKTLVINLILPFFPPPPTRIHRASASDLVSILRIRSKQTPVVLGILALILLTNSTSQKFVKTEDAIEVTVRNPIGWPLEHYELRWRERPDRTARWEWRNLDNEEGPGPWSKADMALLNGDRINWTWMRK